MQQTQYGSIEMAKLGLTSIITSCSGLLIGLLVYAGQGELTAANTPFLITAAGLSGAALFFGILSSVIAYVSQLLFDNERDNRLAWIPAFCVACFSLLLFGAAMILGIMMLLA